MSANGPQCKACNTPIYSAIGKQHTENLVCKDATGRLGESLAVQVPSELKARLRAMAEQKGTTMTQEAIAAIESHLAATE